jgi:hypothetical protein
MGNQGTKSMGTIQLQIILDQVPHTSTYVIIEELKKIKISENFDLECLAGELFEHALTMSSASRKYSEIARKLCILMPPDRHVGQNSSNIQWTLHDFINRKAQEYFVRLKDIPLASHKYEIAVFLGNLYCEDLISDENMALWIGSMHNGLENQTYKRWLLITIKPKVVQKEEVFNGSDPFVWQLYLQLCNENLIAKPSQRTFK